MTCPQVHSKQMLAYLDSLKRQAGNKKEFTEAKAVALFQKLQRYKQSVLSIDEKIKERMGGFFILVSKEFDSLQKCEAEFMTSLTEASAQNTFLFLSRLQNNVCINENILITFLHDQIAWHGDHFRVFEAFFLSIPS